MMETAPLKKRQYKHRDPAESKQRPEEDHNGQSASGMLATLGKAFTTPARIR